MAVSENILYELLNTAEWPAHHETLDGSSESDGSLFQHSQWTSLKKGLSASHTVFKHLIPFSTRVTPQLASVVDGSSGWKVSSCRAGGGVVAVLQDAHLEIRHANHNYEDIIARSDTLLADPFPRWRQLSWSSDGTLLAVAYSNGVVQLYTTLAQLLYTIYPPRYKEGAVYFEPNRALALLTITDDLIKDTKWLCEVVCVEYSGAVRSYLVSATEGYQVGHTFSLAAAHYRHGITAATLHKSLLVVAGPSQHMSDTKLSYFGLGHGITLWRRLDQHPYYKQVSCLDDDTVESSSGQGSFLQGLASRLLRPATSPNTAFTLRVSPDGRHLAALHLSGAVSLWHFPSLRKSKYWQLHDQPEAAVTNVPSTKAAAEAHRLLLAAKEGGGQHSPPDLLKPGQPLSLEWWSREDDGGSGGTTEGGKRGGGEDGLVLCRTNGALTISSINTFANLLGDNPEFLAGSPMVCEPQRGGFLCLELERRVARRRRHTSTASSTAPDAAAAPVGPAQHAPDYPHQYDGDEGQSPWEEDGGAVGGWDADSGQWVPAASLLPPEGEEGLLPQQGDAEGQGPEHPQDKQPPIGYLEWMLVLFWNFLYWLTDDQRFQVSTVDVIEEQYRLVLFKSSSPEDLFTNKIHAQEYGEALLLARTYDLDTDLVYQEQWLHSSPSLASISDYLSRVRCRDWALQQCLSVVPGTLLPARELLMYGLRGTDLNVLAAIGSGEDDGEWLSGPSLFDCEDQQQRQELLQRLAQLEHTVDWKFLTEEQKSLISVRQRLLRYLDRLDTYEYLMGGGQFAVERYDPAFYATFREQSSVAACLQFARAADVDAVSIMWTYHGGDTLCHRLAILSNLPPTLGPFEYRALLPACGVDGAVCEWPCSALREEDWCEQPRLVGSLSKSHPAELLDDICSLYASAPGVADLSGGLYDAGDFANAAESSEADIVSGGTTKNTERKVQSLTPEVVSRWYQLKAQQLEKECGLVDAALDLLKLGRERNVQGLEPLLSSLSTLEVLVYETGHTHMSLDQLAKLPHTRLLAMLLDKTAGGPSFLHQMKEWVLPYLERCETANPGSRDALLAEYLQEQAQSSLLLPRTVLQFVCSCPDLLRGDALYRCAVACVYACKDPGQLDTATALLDDLPVTTSSVSLSDLQQLRLQLWCCSVLQRNNVPVLPSALVDIGAEDAAHLYVRMARAKVRESAELSLTPWEELLDDMLELQQKVLQCTTPQHCYRSVADALLTSGVPQYIEFAAEFFMAAPSSEGRSAAAPDASNPYMEGVEYKQAVTLVVDAARGYYNSAEHYKDDALDMAKQCLALLQVEQEAGVEELVQEERDLITALEILHEFDVDMLPLQVRLCSDRQRLVEAALKSNPALCLQYWWRLLQLAQLLRILHHDKAARETAVLAMIAGQALQMRELEACYGLCERLMALGRSEGWEVCAALARLHDYQDLAAKARLLDYALTHCPGHMLPDLVDFRNSVELGIVCQRADTQMASEGVPAAAEAMSDSEDQFEDAQDRSWPEAPSEGGGRGARLLQATLGATHSVSAGASSVLAAVGRRTFWTSAVRWLAPLQGLPLDQLESSSEDNSAFELQGCHAFFADNCPEAHLSNIGYRYDSYSSPSPPSPALQFSLDLLHAALLQRSLAPQDAPRGEDQEHGKVVAEVSRAVLPEDTALGMSLLLMLQQPEQARAVLLALPNTDIAIQVRQYYYALQIYSTLYPWPRPTTAPVFLHDPATVVACAAQIVAKHAEHEDAQRSASQGTSSKGTQKQGTPSKGAQAQKTSSQATQDTPYQRLEKDGVRFYTGDKLMDERLTKYYSYFRETEELLDDFVQGQALHRLDAGVDVKRFLSDASYKEDTVLGLCMTTEKDIMDLAVVLAKKYNVSLWEVHMTQLQYLFISELTTEDLKKDIQARKVVDILKSKPQDFLQRLRSNVLALIDGTDHERLVLFFSLMLDCKADQSSCEEAAKHIEVLRQLKKLAPRLSYHYLLRPHSDVMEHLGTVVRSNNVSQLATLVEALPGAPDQPRPVTRSTVYSAHCIRHFLGLAKEKASGLQQADWLRRYTEVSRHWAELTCPDVLVLTRAIVLSEEAFKLVPLGARIAVLDAAVKASVNKEGEKAEWSLVSQELLQWKVHLASLQTPAFEALTSGPDLALRRYAKMYGTSGGSPSAVATLCSRVLVEDCDLDTLRELVAAMPDDAAPQPEDTLHEMVQRALDALLLQEGDKPDPLLPEHLCHAPPPSQRQWWLARLRHLLTVLGRELRQDNDLLMEELLLEGIRGAVRDQALPREDSITLMRDTCESIPVLDEDKNMLLYLETCQLVEEASFPVLCTWATHGGEACPSSDLSDEASAFHSLEDIADTSSTVSPGAATAKEAGQQTKECPVKEEDGAVGPGVADTSSSEGGAGRRVTITLASVSEEHRREVLFEQLLSVSSSKEHTRALLRLLQLWPPFSKQTYESVSGNPWEAVLTRLVAEASPGGEKLPGDLMWDTVQRAVGLDQLPSSSLGHLTLELLALGQPAWLLAAKLALCRPNPRAITAVLQNYTIAGDKVIGADYDDEMFAGLVEQRLVPRLIGTPLYEPCCQYLIRAGDSAVLQGVIEQLQQSHPHEGAALQQRVAVARPPLASLSSAFRKVYNRLL